MYTRLQLQGVHCPQLTYSFHGLLVTNEFYKTLTHLFLYIQLHTLQIITNKKTITESDQTLAQTFPTTTNYLCLITIGRPMQRRLFVPRSYVSFLFIINSSNHEISGYKNQRISKQVGCIVSLETSMKSFQHTVMT